MNNMKTKFETIDSSDLQKITGGWKHKSRVNGRRHDKIKIKANGEVIVKYYNI